MTGPAFSICIPNFNHGRFIGETLESALGQTYRDFEIVVVDNASTDQSVSVVESLKSDRIRLFRNPYNVGFGPNLDRAASRARNPFIIVVSSDDLMEPDALAVYAEAIETLGERATRTLIVSGVTVIDENGARTDRYDRRYFLPRVSGDPVTLSGGTVAMMIDGHAAFRDVWPRMMVPGAFCSTCYSRDLYESVGGYSSTNLVGPDCHFTNKVLLSGARVVFVEKDLFRYRIHGGGQAGTFRGLAGLKSPVDHYIFTIQYSDQELALAGMSRDPAVTQAVRGGCLLPAARCLADRNYSLAFRHWAFSWAGFPGRTARDPLSWVVGCGICLGPVGSLGARVAKRFLRSSR